MLVFFVLNSRDRKNREDEVDVESFNKNEQPLDGGENYNRQQVTEKEEPSEGTFTQIMAHKTPVEKISDQKTSIENTMEQKGAVEQTTALKTDVELKENQHDMQQLAIEIEKDNSNLFKDIKEHSTLSSESSPLLKPCEILESERKQTLIKEKSSLNTSTNDSKDYSELTRKQEDNQRHDEENTGSSFKDERIGRQLVDNASKNLDENTTEYPSNNGDDNVELEAQSSFLSTEENENSNDGSICDPNSELLQEKNDSSAMIATASKTETNTFPLTSKPSNPSPKIKTSKGPKIKRTLSRAERLSRTRKAKSGLSLKMSLSLKVSPSTKQQRTPGTTLPSKADTPGVSLPSKGASPLKASIKSEKTVQRRRSFKGGRSSSISPRGYGYSMAFMDIEKPLPSGVKTEEESEVPTTENELTVVKISTQSTTCTTTSPTSPTALVAMTENQAAPKKQTYQAKKFRLDQITGKLSAQRQSEAQAAAHSPSAFQLTKHHSSPPPPPTLSPSPPANPPPYPIESYPPPPGPPPLIYSPMPGSCCPTPHHQHMYGPHPGHRMHLPTGHMHPHPDYPPPSSGYMLYAHGMHYPPHGPCMGQCKYFD